MFSNTNKPKSLFKKQTFFTGECCPEESECCVDSNVSTPPSSVNCAWALAYAIIDDATGDTVYTSGGFAQPLLSRTITQFVSLPQTTGDYRLEVYFNTITSPSGTITITAANMNGGDLTPFTLSSPLPVAVSQGSPYTVGVSNFDGTNVAVLADSFEIETDCGNLEIEFEIDIVAL